jgi:hypothetical protein
VATQHVELVHHVGGRGGEQVAGVAVAGDETQRLLLPATADEDRWVRAAQRRRRAQGLGELIVLRLERAVVVWVPHLQADL